jgi:hypothetical protein
MPAISSDVAMSRPTGRQIFHSQMLTGALLVLMGVLRDPKQRDSFASILPSFLAEMLFED